MSIETCTNTHVFCLALLLGRPTLLIAGKFSMYHPYIMENSPPKFILQYKKWKIVLVFSMFDVYRIKSWTINPNSNQIQT